MRTTTLNEYCCHTWTLDQPRVNRFHHPEKLLQDNEDADDKFRDGMLTITSCVTPKS